MSTSIAIEYIDTNLISGSEELRTQLEQSWEFVSSSEGESLEFNGNVDYDGGITYFLKSVEANMDLKELTTEEVLSPSYKVPIRIIGNEELILNDEVWAVYLMGGSYNTSSYNGIYSSTVYSDFYVSCKFPYTKYLKNVLSRHEDTGYEAISVSPVYNYHLKEYQEYVTTKTSGLIPNIYLYQIAADAEPPGTGMNEELLNYITLDNQISDLLNLGDSESPISALLEPTQHQMLPPQESLYLGMDDDGDSGDDYMVDRNYNLRRYLSSSFPQFEVSGTTAAVVAGNMSEIIFDDMAVNNLLKHDAPVLTTRELFPYYVNIEMPVNYKPENYDDPTIFRSIIKNNNFIQKFMEELRQFADDKVPKQEHNVVTNFSYNTGSEDSTIITSVKASEGDSYQALDFTTFLYKIHNNAFTTKTSRGLFMRGEDYNVRATINDLPPYVYNNTRNVLNVLQDTVEYLNNNIPELESLQDLYDLAQTSKYYEVLAYRIEKTASDGTVLQNYWIYNSEELEDTLTFVDSQVIYGVEYTYNIYLYKLIVGIKYKFSDMVYTKQIADPAILSEGEATSYCLQFFSIDTGTESEQLFETEDEIIDINPLAASNSVIKDENPFLADFMINYEPSIKIIEIPLHTKTVSVIDNPPSTLDIIPFQVLDDSRMIGFQINYEAFTKTKIPSALSQFDYNYRNSYIKSYDMLQDDKVTMPSRSRAKTVQVFRLSEKPTALIDFGEEAHTSYDLILEDEKASKSIVYCHDRINTNKKYYYLFRALNEFAIAGPETEIYEIELVNDGGSNYLKTNTFFESDLDISTYTEPSKLFKKIIQLSPAVNQLSLETANVDFDQPSYTQLDNLEVGSDDLEEKIWGKTFKLRLTSKKTGKKIDLNITYNMSNG